MTAGVERAGSPGHRISRDRGAQRMDTMDHWREHKKQTMREAA